MVKESAFNRKFRKEMEALGMKLYRVESHSTCPGIPDNHYLVKGTGAIGWIEIKEMDDENFPKRIKFRPNQVPWHLDYAANGGVSWILVSVPRRNAVCLVYGSEALVASKDLASTHSLAISLDWDEPWKDLFHVLVKSYPEGARRRPI